MFVKKFLDFLIMGVAVEMRVMSTTNLVKLAGAGSTNTAIEPSAHSMYEPNLMVTWDRGGYGTAFNTVDPQKVPMMPGVKNLHITGQPCRFVWHMPKYLYGRTGVSTNGLPISTTIGSALSIAIEAADVPQSIRFHWLDIGDYLSSTTAAQAATWRIAFRTCLVGMWTQQTIFNGQP
jgi:hypothetical protein